MTDERSSRGAQSTAVAIRCDVPAVWAMIASLIAALRLQSAILSLYGAGAPESIWRTVRPSDAARGAMAATLTAGSWPVEIVATLAVRETSMRWLVNPTSGACGPGQILVSRDPDKQARFCARHRRAPAAVQYAWIARKLDRAAAYCRAHHRRDVDTCALSGYIGGVPAVMGGWTRTPREIQRRAAKLRVAMFFATGHHGARGDPATAFARLSPMKQ